MKRLSLVSPSVAYEAEYLSMLADWREHDAAHIPWFIDAGGGFHAFVKKLDGFSRGEGLGEGYMPNTTFWLLGDDGKILGAINIRHRLNEVLLRFGGQIGHGVRPGERRKGYATHMLRLGLTEAKKLGLEKVLICCYTDHFGSVRTIEANGGTLENQKTADGKTVNRYWIQL